MEQKEPVSLVAPVELGKVSEQKLPEKIEKIIPNPYAQSEMEMQNPYNINPYSRDQRTSQMPPYQMGGYPYMYPYQYYGMNPDDPK